MIDKLIVIDDEMDQSITSEVNNSQIKNRFTKMKKKKSKVEENQSPLDFRQIVHEKYARVFGKSKILE